MVATSCSSRVRTLTQNTDATALGEPALREAALREAALREAALRASAGSDALFTTVSARWETERSVRVE